MASASQPKKAGPPPSTSRSPRGGERSNAKRPLPVRDRIVGLSRVTAGELLPNPKRWRRHSEAQERALRQVLDAVGYADAVLVRQSADGLVLIDGHLRKDLDPAASLPVLVLDVTEEEAETLLATLDPLAGMALPDVEALEALLASAVVPEEVLEHLQTLLLRGPSAGRTDPDETPERPKKPAVRRGDLWALGPHRLLCGDATSATNLNRLMAGERADLLWTDPPFGVGYVGKTPRALTLANDQAEGLDRLLGEAFTAAAGVLRPGAALYVAHPTGGNAVVFVAAFSLAGWRLHQSLVWVKDRMVLGHADYHHRHEGLLYGYAPGPGRWGRGHRGWYGGNAQDSVFEIARPQASREHPTQKPVELVRRCLQNSSRSGGRVLDPFCGSGSTVIACTELGRRAYLMDIDRGYCEVSVRRWEAFTGERAVRLDGN